LAVTDREETLSAQITCSPNVAEQTFSGWSQLGGPNSTLDGTFKMWIGELAIPIDSASSELLAVALKDIGEIVVILRPREEKANGS